MRSNRLPVLLCHANCPKCGMPTDQFKMFESGLGGDFETYVGATSGTLYRLDLGKVHYQKMSREDILADALGKETRLIPIPQGEHGDVVALLKKIVALERLSIPNKSLQRAA